MRSLVHISVRTEFYFLAVLSLFLLPVKWVAGWIIAACIHELFHLLIIKLIGGKILSIHLCASGAVIATGPMESHQEALCAIAGPVGGLFALLMLRIAPQIALCAAIQSAYNFLPIYPLDGGRFVKCVIACFLGDEKAERISSVMSVIMIFLITASGLWLSVCYRLGILPVIFPSVPLICSAYKNSLQRRENNSTIALRVTNSERTLY